MVSFGRDVSTRPCPNCGHLVPEQGRFCGQCGTTLGATDASPAKAAPPANLGKTLLDSNPFGASQKPAAKTLMQTVNDPHAHERARAMLDEALEKQDVHTAETAKRPAVPLAKTMMLGSEAPSLPHPAPAPPTATPEASPLSKSVLAPGSIPPPAPQPQPQAQAQAPAAIAASGSRTMLGMPARDLPPAAAAPPAQPPANLPPAMKTMLGVAIPGIAPTHEPRAPGALAATAPLGAEIGNVNRPQGTLLGVAVPGIAPTHGGPPPAPAVTGVASAGRTNVGFPAAVNTLPPIVPAPAPLVDEPIPEAPRLPAKRGVPAVVVVLIVFLLVAAAGGAAAFFVLRSGAPLAAAPQLDENGRESLKISCASCPDGTTVSLGASSAQVAGGAAVLPLPAPLSIGDNDLEVKIDRPGSGRDESVTVHVPVAYRVRADMATLSAKPPAITVRVEAMPGSEVSVEGTPVPLDATGRGAYPIDLAKDVEGTSDESKTIEKKIAFSITPKGGKPEAGSLVARTAIVPLHLDAPGTVLYTDRPSAAVSGQTKTGGTLAIDGQVAPVDAQGRFGVRVEMKDPGEKPLEIVASAPPLAPRIVHAKVIRVASLEDAAKELESKGPLAFDAFAADPSGKVGQAVAVDGEVVETRAQQGYTVMLVDAKQGCAAGKGACIVRIVHGEELKAARGDTVRAYGVLEGSVTSAGKTVPDIDASLVIVKAGSGK